MCYNKDGKIEKLLPLSDYISLEGLSAGYYTVCLKKGASESPHCSFAVVDAVSYAKKVAASTAQVNFSSSIGTPVWVQWMDLQNGTVHVSVLTSEDLASGKTFCSYQSGKYKIRVAFSTEYGIIHSELPDEINLD